MYSLDCVLCAFSYTSNPADTVAAGLLGGCDLDCGSYYQEYAQVLAS